MTKNTMAFLLSAVCGALTPMVVLHMTDKPISEAAADTIVEVYGPRVSESEILCLAINSYHEARGENFAGRLGMMNVVKNRVASKEFPDTICDVVKSAKKNSKGQIIKNKCAFSYFCDGISDIPKDLKTFEKLEQEARWFLEERPIDITEGSLYYHSVTVNPGWPFVKVGRIGNSVFYR